MWVQYGKQKERFKNKRVCVIIKWISKGKAKGKGKVKVKGKAGSEKYLEMAKRYESEKESNKKFNWYTM